MEQKSNILLRGMKVATITCFLIVVVLLGYFISTSPVAFQKVAAVTFIEESEIALPEPKSYVDIRQILHGIPYKGGMVYEVEPKYKYEKTIQEGYGNCSNLAFGLGYYLSKHEHEFQIIHLMPPDGFLAGQGHTVVNMPYTIDGKTIYGIVDVLEGGLPRNNDLFIDINSLRKGNFNNPSILPLNPNKDHLSPYYHKEFLSYSVLGVIKGEEVKSYFKFIENIYIPLGNRKLEKILYDGLSIVFGYYPKIYVLQEDSEALFKGNEFTKILAVTLLVSMRVLIFLFGFLVIVYMVFLVNGRITHKD